MKRVYAWLLALEIDLRLKLRESPHWPRPGGWVVMCEEETGDWHAQGGGADYGMNIVTGRFPTRDAARAFAIYRNRLDDGARYYVAHEDLLHRPLPPTY
ncbi:hypothetical protein [Stenotrophomonas phage BUCT603B1]|nr:hypothetical protein [Stenotrophomonas phage BUCT603B1]